MIKSFMNYALDRGIHPELKPQNAGAKNETIIFDKDGLHFVFLYNKEKDPNYFELVLPYIDDFDTTNSSQLDKLMSMTKDYKVGKVIVTKENRVNLTFEQYSYSTENLNKLFEQGIGCLEAMINDYRRAKASSNNFSLTNEN